MECIGKIVDEDFDLKSVPFNNPRHRFGARGIIFNKDGKIAILNKCYKNEYKLIGGGIENNEDVNTAFEREALEESGCLIKIDECLGLIEEYKSLDNFRQTSYVFVAHVIDDTGKTHFTIKEKEEGSKILWLDIDEAMEKIKKSEAILVASKYESVYHTKFIARRDYKILEYYKTNN